ncbi:hypothetical protein WG66_003248 [Moniliophthora roreri]|nr:hypothetical protein WG66_003248 [Moniliophthora roreri]
MSIDRFVWFVWFGFALIVGWPQKVSVILHVLTIPPSPPDRSLRTSETNLRPVAPVSVMG